MGKEKNGIRGERRPDGTMHRHAAHTTPVTLFVPFSVEISGAWGLTAQRFHKEALAHVNNAFDIEYFH